MLRQITYQGVFEPTGRSTFGVYFPDLPGCTSYGETLGEAQKNAQNALGLHLYGMEQDGDPVPVPSATPEVDPETAVGYLVYPVTIFMLNYKGYFAMSEYSAEDCIFYGKILGISDLVDFQSKSAKDLEDEFHKAVDEYLAFCEEIEKEPQREHSGQSKKEAFKRFLSLFPEKGLDLDPEQAREEWLR